MTKHVVALTFAGMVSAVAFGLAPCAEPQWISGNSASRELPAPVMLKEFTLAKVPAKAELTLAVAGLQVTRVNGRRVGDEVLSPVTGQPDMRASSLKRDITRYLRPGANTLEVLLGNGWYNCFTRGAWGFEKAQWLGAPKICGELIVDGERLFVTDASWRVYDSPIIFNALRNGEYHDAMREGKRLNLRPATVDIYGPLVAVSPEIASPCRASEPLKPIKSFPSADGGLIYDFGSNRAGWCAIDVVGEAGARITIDYDEELNKSGDDFAGYVNSFQRWNKDPRPGQHDEYTLAGRPEGEKWQPNFTYHGFRYAKVKTFGKLTLRSIESVFVHSDFAKVGQFAISDKVFAKLLDAANRSYLSNFVGIPTDCPHREKNGWTGDIQLAMETGLWNFEARGSYRHFLQMMLDAQRPNGAVPCILPCTDTFGFGWGSGPAWDAVLFEIPWQLYRYYGDDSAARDAYPAMKKYLAFITTKARADGLIEYGLGDWCPPHGYKVASLALTDSAYVYEFYRRTAIWAERFADRPYADHCRARAAQLRELINRAFYKGNGVYDGGQPTALACALYFPGLIADGAERPTVKELVRKVRELKHQAWFGIFGAKWVPRVLADHGYIDDAWQIFVQPQMPGYAYWMSKGYDTLWEIWNDEGGLSRNHIMYGDFSAWAYEYVAGIKIVEPGFAKYDVKPHLPAGVDSFDVSYTAPNGKVIKVSAKRSPTGQPVYVK